MRGMNAMKEEKFLPLGSVIIVKGSVKKACFDWKRCCSNFQGRAKIF